MRVRVLGGRKMARVSVKENKNIYHKTREALQLTRESTAGKHFC